jgi:hypothetical protein
MISAILKLLRLSRTPEMTEADYCRRVARTGFTCNDPLASVISLRVLKSRLSNLKRGWAPDWKDRVRLARWLAGEAVR